MNTQVLISSTGQDTVSSPMIMQTIAVNQNSINNSVGNLPIKSMDQREFRNTNNNIS